MGIYNTIPEEITFSPVKFRIKFKIALMVFKCMNNIAPDYLSSLIKLRSPNKYSIRLDNEFYLLEIIIIHNLLIYSYLNT